MSEIKITLEGRRRLAAKLSESVRRTDAGVNRAVAEAGEDLLAKTLPVTPLLTGELRQSGFVDHAPGEAVVGFSAPHALYVHEMPAHYNFTTPGTGPKYLQNTFSRERSRYVRHIQQAARGGIG